MPGKASGRCSTTRNTISNNSANDSRHRFNATFGDGTKLYLGTQASLGDLPIRPFTSRSISAHDGNSQPDETKGELK